MKINDSKIKRLFLLVAAFAFLSAALGSEASKEMPFDQHELLSCVAPRILAVGSGTSDHWAGPDGEKKATELARAAWDDPSRVSYHCHEGKHNLGLVDWEVYLSHVEKFWMNKRKD